MRVLHESASGSLTARRSFRILCVGAAIVGCADDASRTSASVRDSAGIEIVENTGAGVWTPTTAWTVADTPSVSIGGDESDTTTLFARVQNALKLGDGHIVVMNYGTRQIRFYDASGRFLTAAGGPGKGPGEFNWLGRALRTEGDSLVFWDPNNARLSVFDSAGRFARSVPLRTGQNTAFPDPMGRLADGSLVGQTGRRTPGTGAVRYAALYVRYGPDLAPLDTIAERPGSERFIDPCGDGMCGYEPPFARTTNAAFWRDRLFVGTADRYEIDVIAVDGRVLRSIRSATPSRPVTEADVARWRAQELSQARNEEARKELERVYAMMPIPKTMPAYLDLAVDRLGNLWVEDYRAADEAPRWTVFDSAGRMLGTVATPRSLRIDEIGDDYLLGVFRDSLDVEHVRLHRLLKPRD
jgi:hypothetical protein